MKIFVDQDGVLADFKRRFVELYHKEPEQDYKKKESLYYNNFKEIIDNGHFASLDPMPDLQEGLSWLKSISNNNQIYILTSTAREEYFQTLAEQKYKWLIEHNIPYMPIFVPGKRFKKIYSSPGAILIDDTNKNIEDWNSNQGIGIYHKSWKETIEKISLCM